MFLSNVCRFHIGYVIGNTHVQHVLTCVGRKNARDQSVRTGALKSYAVPPKSKSTHGVGGSSRRCARRCLRRLGSEAEHFMYHVLMMGCRLLIVGLMFGLQGVRG